MSCRGTMLADNDVCISVVNYCNSIVMFSFYSVITICSASVLQHDCLLLLIPILPKSLVQELVSIRSFIPFMGRSGIGFLHLYFLVAMA